MDRRIAFFFVFVFTVISTMLVAVVSFATQHEPLTIVLYSVATMWIVGIVSQVLVLNLYQGIIKPLEERQARARELAAKREANLEEIEAIDDLSVPVEEIDPTRIRDEMDPEDQEDKQETSLQV